MTGRPALEHHDIDSAFASVDGIVCSVWNRPPLSGVMTHYRTFLESIVATHTTGVGVIVLARVTSLTRLDVSEPVRHDLARSFRVLASREGYCAVIVEGQGFLATSTRALFNGFKFLSFVGERMQFLPSVRAGAEWLATCVHASGSSVTADDIAETMALCDRSIHSAKQSTPTQLVSSDTTHTRRTKQD